MIGSHKSYKRIRNAQRRKYFRVRTGTSRRAYRRFKRQYQSGYRSGFNPNRFSLKAGFGRGGLFG